jgi:hypothetical protein
MEPASHVPQPRPGGLTALAVINLVLALLGMVLGGPGLTALRESASDQAQIVERAAEQAAMQEEGDPELNRAMAKGMAAQMRTASPQAWRLMLAFGYTGGVLLIVSAFGLLGQRRLTGRHVATAAGVALFACAVVAVMRVGLIFAGVPMLGAVYGMILVIMVHTAYGKTLSR